MSPGALRAPPLRPSGRGFTLIEVMVSLFVLAVMAGMAWQGVDMVVRSRDSALARTEGSLRLQNVLAQWETDLREMVATEIAPGFEAQGNSLRMTRQMPDGIAVVTWTLRGGHWVRWASPAHTRAEALQESWLASYQLLGNEAGTLDALTGVATVQLYTFQGGAWANAQSTGELDRPDGTGSPQNGAPGAGQPPGGTRERLPDGVRLVMTFRPAEERDAGGRPPSASGTLTRVLRLIHP